MTGTVYTVLAFVIGLLLPLGYAALLWLAHRRLSRRRP